MIHRVAPLFLGACLLAAPSLAAEIRSDATVSLAAGFDSNPLKQAGDGPDSGFADLSFRVAADAPLLDATHWFVTASGRRRMHESDGNADTTTADLRAGLAVYPFRERKDLLLVRFGGLFGLFDSTLTDRATGRIYEVPTPDLSGTTSIPNRFDNRTGGAFFDARWRVHPRLRLSLDTRLESTRYPEEYSHTTDLAPLDYRSVTLEPGVLFQLNSLTTLGLSLMFNDLDFTDQAALDDEGQEVAGTKRQYRYSEVQISVRVSPGDLWNVQAGLRSGDRQDTYAGYYDSGATIAYLSLDRRMGERTRFQVYSVMRDLDYDRATVGGLPEGIALAEEVRVLGGRFNWDFRKHVAFFAEGGVQDNESRDPAFTHDRKWVLTGLRFQRKESR